MIVTNKKFSHRIWKSDGPVTAINGKMHFYNAQNKCCSTTEITVLLKMRLHKYPYISCSHVSRLGSFSEPVLLKIKAFYFILISKEV